MIFIIQELIYVTINKQYQLHSGTYHITIRKQYMIFIMQELVYVTINKQYQFHSGTYNITIRKQYMVLFWLFPPRGRRGLDKKM